MAFKEILKNSGKWWVSKSARYNRYCQFSLALKITLHSVSLPAQNNFGKHFENISARGKAPDFGKCLSYSLSYSTQKVIFFVRWLFLLTPHTENTYFLEKQREQNIWLRLDWERENERRLFPEAISCKTFLDRTASNFGSSTIWHPTVPKKFAPK